MLHSLLIPNPQMSEGSDIVQGIISRRRTSTMPRNLTLEEHSIPTEHAELIARLAAQGVQVISVSPRFPSIEVYVLMFDAIKYVEQCHRIATGLNTGSAKRLTIRYTTDNWKTYRDEVAAPMESNGGFADRFCAILLCPPDDACSSVSFAVRYEVAGREYWDNNGGRNYTISVSSA